MSTGRDMFQQADHLAQDWRVGTYEWWPAADRLAWSPELARLYGLTQAPVDEQGFTRLVHPEDRVRVEGETSNFLGSNVSSYSHMFRILRPDGTVRVILDRATIERDTAGNVRVIHGINIDVTDEARSGALAERPAAQTAAEQELTEAKALLESLFDNAPVGLGLWDRDFRFLRLNRELAAMNGLPPEAHIGHRPDEILPEIAGLDDLYQNWRRLLQTGEPWRAVEISGETPAQPGRWRHWQEDFFPVRLGDRTIGIAAIVQETTRQKAAEDALRASEARYRMLFDAIDEGFCIIEVRFDAPGGRADYRVTEANPAFFARTGFPRAILGRWLRKAAPELEEHWYEIYGHVARTGEPVRFEQGSDLLGRWFDVFAFPIDAVEDQRLAILFSDATDRKRHAEQTQLLLHEINHRSKNMLSLVLAIARNTAFSGADDFLDRFGKRVQALAVAQDLLVENEWQTVPLVDLVRSQLSHFSDLIGQRIRIGGPPLSITSAATQAIGMALHELATNAAKYGALSTDAGRIAITWTVEPADGGEPHFALCWQESGGPPVVAPRRRGFGSTVTTGMVETSTGGAVTVDFAQGGLVWRLTCPVAHVRDGQTWHRAAPAPTAPEHLGTPGSQRVLVVEDEPLIATEIAFALSEVGFSIVGPAGTAHQALALLEGQGCDAAVLDVHLGYETSEAVALELARRGTPYVVVSGYSKAQLPEAFRSAPLAAKPLQPMVLEGLLRDALDRP